MRSTRSGLLLQQNHILGRRQRQPGGNKKSRRCLACGGDGARIGVRVLADKVPAGFRDPIVVAWPLGAVAARNHDVFRFHEPFQAEPPQDGIDPPERAGTLLARARRMASPISNPLRGDVKLVNASSTSSSLTKSLIDPPVCCLTMPNYRAKYDCGQGNKKGG